MTTATLNFELTTTTDITENSVKLHNYYTAFLSILSQMKGKPILV
jgi:hypothetical protein